MNIKYVQSQLFDLGFYHGPIDGDLGPDTLAAVQKFQAANGIVPASGVVGPRTLAALDTDTRPTSQNLAERAKQYMIYKNGVREATGHNDGPDVEMFLASVGLSKGNYWCMAMVYWAVNEAAKDLNLPNPLVRTGGVHDQWYRTTCQKGNVPAANAIFVIFLSETAGHCGMTDIVLSKGLTVQTAEGNTNNNGSANGDGVYYPKLRDTSHIHGYIYLPVN